MQNLALSRKVIIVVDIGDLSSMVARALCRSISQVDASCNIQLLVVHFREAAKLLRDFEISSGVARASQGPRAFVACRSASRGGMQVHLSVTGQPKLATSFFDFVLRASHFAFIRPGCISSFATLGCIVTPTARWYEKRCSIIVSMCVLARSFARLGGAMFEKPSEELDSLKLPAQPARSLFLS